MNEFRLKHNKMVAKMFNWFFFAHVLLAPVLAIVYKTELSIAVAASFLIFFINIMASGFLSGSKTLVDLTAANAMFSSALVMYLMRGMPEAHYHFFVSMSFLIAYAMPRAIVVATLVISAHHISFYFLLPGAGFPIDYPFDLYALHFVAAVAQAVPSFVISLYAGKIVDNQGNIIKDLKENAHETQNRSSTLVSQSSQMSSAITGQAQAIDETVATLDELSSIMNSNINSIENSNESVTKSHGLLRDCKKTMHDVSTAMKDIDESNEKLLQEVANITSRFSDIEATMNNISSKTQIINDITFQTKLLSFNASVESARAGEHGKGFAVVAEEVGNLAQTSSVAAVEINDLITGGTEEINSLLDDIQKSLQTHLGSSKDKVNVAVHLTEDSLSSLDVVYDSFESLKKTFESITVASREQGEGFHNIHDAIRLFQGHIKTTQDMIESSNKLSNEMNVKSAEIIKFVSSLDTSSSSSHENDESDDFAA